MPRRSHSPRAEPPRTTGAQLHMQDVATVQLGLALGLHVRWNNRHRMAHYRHSIMLATRDVRSVVSCEVPDDWQPVAEDAPPPVITLGKRHQQ